MLYNLVELLRNMPSHKATRVIASAPQYIKNDRFINILNQFDFNSDKNDASLTLQLNAFVGIVGLSEHVRVWLIS